jgi:hypothetical protein
MNREEQVRIIAKVCCLSNVDCAMKIVSYLKFLLLAIQDKMVRSKDGALCTSCEGRGQRGMGSGSRSGYSEPEERPCDCTYEEVKSKLSITFVKFPRLFTLRTV